MKKLLSLLLISSFIFAYSFDSSINSSNKDMIFRMNIQNADGSRGEYTNTTVPKVGWLNLNGYTTAPVTANVTTGNAILYYDYTKDAPVVKIWKSDVSGNITSADLSTTANTVYSFASTAALANATASGTLTVTGATALNGGLTMDTNKFTVADASGNTAIAGTLAVTGNATLRGTLGVTGVSTLSTVNITTALSLPATSSITVTTGNVNIPVTVGGVTYYIKASTLQ